MDRALLTLGADLAVPSACGRANKTLGQLSLQMHGAPLTSSDARRPLREFNGASARVRSSKRPDNF